jgi:hypothetical protein
MAAILENQFNAWNPEKRSMIFEDQTTTANIADFTRFALPLIRKSYPKLIADNLVGVQPMSQPASLIFYIRYRYALTKGQTVAGTQIMRQNTAQSFARQNGWALDPYYSSQEVKGEDATITGNSVITATLAHRPVLAGTVVVEASWPADAAPNCDDAVPVPPRQLRLRRQPRRRARRRLHRVHRNLTVDTTTPVPPNQPHHRRAVRSPSRPAVFPVRSRRPRQLRVRPGSQPVPAGSHPVDRQRQRRRHHPQAEDLLVLEAAQDLKAVHNIDAESTLTDLMADEMVAEIDREIINDLIIAAAIRADHNFATAAGASSTSPTATSP